MKYTQKNKRPIKETQKIAFFRVILGICGILNLICFSFFIILFVLLHQILKLNLDYSNSNALNLETVAYILFAFVSLLAISILYAYWFLAKYDSKKIKIIKSFLVSSFLGLLPMGVFLIYFALQKKYWVLETDTSKTITIEEQKFENNHKLRKDLVVAAQKAYKQAEQLKNKDEFNFLIFLKDHFQVNKIQDLVKYNWTWEKALLMQAVFDVVFVTRQKLNNLVFDLPWFENHKFSVACKTNSERHLGYSIGYIIKPEIETYQQQLEFYDVVKNNIRDSNVKLVFVLTKKKQKMFINRKKKFTF